MSILTQVTSTNDDFRIIPAPIRGKKVRALILKVRPFEPNFIPVDNHLT